MARASRTPKYKKARGQPRNQAASEGLPPLPQPLRTSGHRLSAFTQKVRAAANKHQWAPNVGIKQSPGENALFGLATSNKASVTHCLFGSFGSAAHILRSLRVLRGTRSAAPPTWLVLCGSLLLPGFHLCVLPFLPAAAKHQLHTPIM